MPRLYCKNSYFKFSQEVMPCHDIVIYWSRNANSLVRVHQTLTLGHSEHNLFTT